MKPLGKYFPVRDLVLWTRILSGLVCIVAGFGENLVVIGLLRVLWFNLDQFTSTIFLPLYVRDLVGPLYLVAATGGSCVGKMLIKI